MFTLFYKLINLGKGIIFQDKSNNNEIILSVCIPTYCNGKYLYNMLEKFLQTKEKNFEIIVSDNCSPDNSFQILKKLNDTRLILMRNEKNLGSCKNMFQAVKKARGKYVLFLTDKDYITSKNLGKVIKLIKSAKFFEVGYFSLNYQKEKSYIKTYKGKADCINAFSYGYNHPSGFILNREQLLNKNIFYKYLSADDYIKTHLIDFLTADIFSIYKGCILKVPFVFMNKPPFEDLKHSFSYSAEKNNIFFFPKYRIQTMKEFINHFEKKNTDMLTRIRVLSQIIFLTYKLCTFDYDKILKDKSICNWYCISNEKIEKEKVKNHIRIFFKYFSKINFYKNNFEKTIIFVMFSYKRMIFNIKHSIKYK